MINPVSVKRVLIVDDVAVNRKLAAAMLKKRGWDIVEVDSGPAALDRLQAEPFDYVLLDISMPGMSGDEVCRLIRSAEATRDLRVVAYTAHALESEKAQIMAAGFDDIIIKPVTIDALLAKFPE